MLLNQKKFVNNSILFVTFFLSCVTTVTAGENSKDLQIPCVVNTCQPSNNTLMYLYGIIFILLCLTLISTAISFYLYRWRRILINNSHYLMPESLVCELARFREGITASSIGAKDELDKLKNVSAENSRKIENMIETFMTFQRAIDEKESEIKRLRNGYDIDVFKRYLGRFIKVSQLIDAHIREQGSAAQYLDDIRKLLDDALDECGVEPFSPRIGEDYRSAVGIADNPKTLQSDNQADEFKIAEVVECGYRVRVNDTYNYIIPAKVRVYTSK